MEFRARDSTASGTAERDVSFDANAAGRSGERVGMEVDSNKDEPAHKGL